MKVQTGALIASIDGDRTAANAVDALRVGDQVFALDQDLAICADRDGAFTDSQREFFFGFDQECIRCVCDSVARTDPTENYSAIRKRSWTPAHDYVPGRKQKRSCFAGAQDIASHLVGPVLTFDLDSDVVIDPFDDAASELFGRAEKRFMHTSYPAMFFLLCHSGSPMRQAFLPSNFTSNEYIRNSHTPLKVLDRMPPMEPASSPVDIM